MIPYMPENPFARDAPFDFTKKEKSGSCVTESKSSLYVELKWYSRLLYKSYAPFVQFNGTAGTASQIH